MKSCWIQICRSLALFLGSASVLSANPSQLLTEADVVLVGSGIMSATLGTLLKELDPNLKIEIIERLGRVAGESTCAWNNAGTGHSALCELNYTPEAEDGSIVTTKAHKVFEQFEVSKQYWAHLVRTGVLGPPENFIHSVPHISVVWGKQDVDYLKRRYETLKQSPFFSTLEFSEDPLKLAKWMPIVMKDRPSNTVMAASRMLNGTDVNFGQIAQSMIGHLQENSVGVSLNEEVQNVVRMENQRWEVEIKNLVTGEIRHIQSKFIFLGAGGGSLPLLQKSRIPEGKGYGGFPVSGQFLVCKNSEFVGRHFSKVYGKAEGNAPPMSVPHLDTRIIDGKRTLIFGPFAGFSTKFLKEGSNLDLFRSIQADNIFPMLGAGWHNMPLTQYLIKQVLQSPEDRMQVLRQFIPDAKSQDWELITAGQRVQVIKKDPKHGGILEFGTEIVVSKDGSIAALLGASPGASTSVPVMINVLKSSFKKQMDSPAWISKLREMIPSYDLKLIENPRILEHVRKQSSEVLHLSSGDCIEVSS